METIANRTPGLMKEKAVFPERKRSQRKTAFGQRERTL